MGTHTAPLLKPRNLVCTLLADSFLLCSVFPPHMCGSVNAKDSGLAGELCHSLHRFYFLWLWWILPSISPSGSTWESLPFSSNRLQHLSGSPTSVTAVRSCLLSKVWSILFSSDMRQENKSAPGGSAPPCCSVCRCYKLVREPCFHLVKSLMPPVLYGCDFLGLSLSSSTLCLRNLTQWCFLPTTGLEGSHQKDPQGTTYITILQLVILVHLVSLTVGGRFWTRRMRSSRMHQFKVKGRSLKGIPTQ